jgi:hypothetical protein
MPGKKKKEAAWKCKQHGIRAHTIFINYRVWCGHHLSQKLFWCLEGDKLENKQPITTFLDHYCLNEGEDWQNGFLNGLNYASLLVLLVQEDLLDNIKHNSTKWQDNVLLEYEAALAKKEAGECLVFPVWVGKYIREEARGVEAQTQKYQTFDANLFPDGPHALSDGSKGKNVRETMSKLFALREEGIFMDPENFHQVVPAIHAKANEAERAKQQWRMDQQKLANNAWVVAGNNLFNVDFQNGSAEVVSRRVRDNTYLVPGVGETLLLSASDNSDLHVAGRQHTGKSSVINPMDPPLEIHEVRGAASFPPLVLLQNVNDDESLSELIFFKPSKPDDPRVEVKDDGQLPSDISHVLHVHEDTFAVFGSTVALVTLKGEATEVVRFTNTWNSTEIQAAAILKNDAFFITSVGTLWQLPLSKGPKEKAHQVGQAAQHESTGLLVVWNGTLVGFSQTVHLIDPLTGSVQVKIEEGAVADVDWTEASSAAMFKAEELEEKKKAK